MQYQIFRKWFFLLTYFFVFGLPAAAFASGGHSDSGVESNIEIEFFSVGDSKSNIGNAQVGTSGVLIEAEYEKNDLSFSFGFERWNYNWSNSESLPFVSGITSTPWSTFNTLQFGAAYEQEVNDQWELQYYVEAESSFEKERSQSNEYEVGVDFT